MYINMKKIYRFGVLLVIGLSMIFYGIINWISVDHSKETLTDTEIIVRARELGMIGIDEKLRRDYDSNE